MRPQVEFNEKQSAIIDVAEKLFAERGFDGASVRDIAQEADVNVAMISYYFGSKEKLMEAVFERKANATRLKVENLLQDTTLSHLQKVYVLIDDYVDKFIHQQEFHKIMAREQMINKHTPIAELIHDLKKRNLGSIKTLIHEGQKSGAFKKNIDVVLMMTTMVGTVSQMIISQNFYRSLNNLEQMDDMEFQKLMRRKLSTHLKNLFKKLITNE